MTQIINSQAIAMRKTLAACIARSPTSSCLAMESIENFSIQDHRTIYHAYEQESDANIRFLLGAICCVFGYVVESNSPPGSYDDEGSIIHNFFAHAELYLIHSTGDKQSGKWLDRVYTDFGGRCHDEPYF